MPSEFAHRSWHRRTEPAELPEWMDEPCTPEDLRVCLRDLGAVNRLTFGYRPTLQFLDRLVERKRPDGVLRILDVGSGGGDGLRRVARWARTRRIRVELTGIDLNPQATRIASERYRKAKITWLTGDALSFAGEADVVISSLLTHHLETEHIVRFLRWMEATALQGWFINDLERSARSARLFTALAGAMQWHRFVQHDGPVSFARSFVRADWMRMLDEAGIEPETVAIRPSFPSRLCVGRLK